MTPYDSQFTCPVCRGSHFGSTFAGDPRDPETVATRHCHDEFNRNCKWSGSDAECMVAAAGAVNTAQRSTETP